MSLDANVKAMLDQMKAMALPKMWELGPQAARAAMRLRFPGITETPTGPITDRTIPGPAHAIGVRIYTPLSATSTVLPGLIFFHGGGFVLGDLDSHDDLCRVLANESGCRVVSIDYRLAPEHPFPAAVDDCFAATKYVAAHAGEFGIDASRLAVGGDSAGGNLAAVVCQLAKGGGPKIAYQLLIYPVTQLGAPVDTPSMRENGKGYFLEKEGMDWFTKLYCPDHAHRTDPRLSPLLCQDLAGQPPAYVITAGFDPLRDEGKDYADALDKAGVSVTYVNYPGMVHGFFSMRALIPKAREAVAAAAAALREGLARTA
ncbi:MAG: alpha/beta hydrolase [Alphaproteobacteria bacterium]|nr:alpha/beta hydrolase [Alphaproteobacteria bacterium]MBL7099374.1 alpha/beta hydrolase [Alphaproteobacteria bacterium]